MYRITKDFTFSSAHSLQGLPDDHPCSRLHGHNYTVRIVLEAEGLNEVGFVRDYNELKKFGDWLDLNFDHRDLTAMTEHIGGSPTAENMARAIYYVAAKMYPETTAIGVSETAKTWAWYMPDVLPIEDRLIAVFENLAENDSPNATALRTALENLAYPLRTVTAPDA
jgi:6-pyruvoyltetrahydropterin/6-carboxytetrahydropterin synthase